MNDANNDPIGSAFNMMPLPKNDVVNNLKIMAHDDSAAKDFEYARSNLYSVIDKATESLDKLAQIADASQHPRAFEVMSTLIKTIVDANKDLLALQKSIRELKDADVPNNEGVRTINQSIFVGSTAELSKIINKIRGNDNEGS
jgi:hypothetical protein